MKPQMFQLQTISPNNY